MNILLLCAAVIPAYLLGSVPTAVWAGKIFLGIDLREHGSGNAGAANAIRVLGWKTGVPVLLIDMAKGWLSAMLPVFFNLAEPGSPLLVNLQIGTGITAIVGHIFPVFAGFRGGKGVATAAGVLLAIHPLLTLSCLGVFLVFVLVTRIVSVGSMSAGIAFPIFLFTLFDTPSLVFKVFSVIMAVALLITHRNNIKRLFRGEEKKLF
ncbi:MAG: glycerol-3-phosphate 1-O-acyltransferase PlsY [Bacteroidales bacterium]|jgi:glycerol-3-phosphate acyltransferase PlsY|nr:glycerol-3-phosphate 1-O-acyltransferase PlsY [Bacteroidales bacterium]